MVSRKALAVALIAVALLFAPVFPVTRKGLVERTEALFYVPWGGGWVSIAEFIDTQGKFNCTVEGVLSVTRVKRGGHIDFFIFSVEGALGGGEIPPDPRVAIEFATFEVERAYIFGRPTARKPEVIFGAKGVEVGGFARPNLTLPFSFTVNRTDHYVFLARAEWLTANMTLTATLRYYAYTEEVRWVSLVRLLYEHIGARL